MYDLKITGGTIVDGTGKERFRGDIGIKDGKIVAIGECGEEAKETYDANGAIVAPGFVDIHTHYDGQISWDEELAPSSIHGVTTAVLGSCGVGFAPVHETDHDTLIQLMEGVEDIPGTALAEGIPWGWETFPEYMDAIDNIPHTIDFLAQVPHDALRVYVMRERAKFNEEATEEDIAKMRDILRDALEHGAIGFSTGRSDNHRSATGQPTPASESSAKELAGIAKAYEGLNFGILQAVNDFDILDGDEHFHREFDVIEQMAEAAPHRPMSVSMMQRDHSPNQWKWMIERAEKANEKGLNMRLQAAARGIGILLGLEATFNPFMGFPSYKKVALLPLEERVAAMRAPGFKEQLLSESSEPLAGDGTPIPPLADYFLANLDMVAMRLFRLGEVPNYEPNVTESFAAEANRQKVSVLSVIFDALLEDEGRSLLYFPLYNYTGMNLNVIHEMLSHPLVLPGLSDGGAHVGTVCDATFPTFLLQHWARDREVRFTLEEMIKKQCGDTADFLGLHDRGTLEVGKNADLNIIDFENLQLQHPTMLYDLPAGGRRLMQHATGYLATFVRGEKIAENGELTGARPGRLVRANLYAQ